MKTKNMAKHIGLNADTLRKGIGTDFIVGRHLFKPAGKDYYLWDVAEMVKWSMGSISQTAKSVLDKITA